MTKITTALIVAFFLWPVTLLAQEMKVTLHYVGPQEGTAWLGVQQGLSEANVQGGFLGQEYKLEVIAADKVAETEITTALLLATDDETIKTMAQHQALQNVPVININSSSNALREMCLPNLIHVTPSEQMLADAEAQWNERNSDTPAKAQSWHPDFVKFAARQLNSRFEKGQGQVMDDDAWAGWASVKMVADSVVQTLHSDAEFMLDHLRNNLVFDGQKGSNNNIRQTGQLRQIVLIVNEQGSEILAEAPLRGVQGGLDSLGQTHCK